MVIGLFHVIILLMKINNWWLNWEEVKKGVIPSIKLDFIHLLRIGIDAKMQKDTKSKEKPDSWIQHLTEFCWKTPNLQKFRLDVMPMELIWPGEKLVKMDLFWNLELKFVKIILFCTVIQKMIQQPVLLVC